MSEVQALLTDGLVQLGWTALLLGNASRWTSSDASRFHKFLDLTLMKCCLVASRHFSGYIGAASCMILANFGSAWGTWQAGLGVCKMGVDYPKGVIKNIVPIVMAGVLGI